AATAEIRSEHPLGKAIIAKAKQEGLTVVEPEAFSYTPGRGIAADAAGGRILVGNSAWLTDNGIAVRVESGTDRAAVSEILVARNGRYLGSIAVADTTRPEARAAMQSLFQMGIKTILLTGDAAAVANAVGRSLNITQIEAGLLPEDKLDRVRALTGAGKIVAMVGDGVNDAPADVAQESADIVLLGNDLVRFVETLKVARRTRGIIWQNFAGTLVIDAVGIGLAAFGLLNPLLAAFIHVASEMTFILNSARLLPPRGSPAEAGVGGAGPLAAE
ncbi:MAG: heavy metal translocating P-type ATPase, partial [Azorhizobium sp. 39-67-5]